MTGIVFAVAAYLMWGFLPLYWKLLAETPVAELLAHRIAWCALFTTLWLALRRAWRLRAILANRRAALLIAAGAVLICTNWGVFAYAVASERVVEASLGYFINPLFTVLLGLVALGERLRRVQWLALGLASVGVAVLVARLEQWPWIALALMVTFGLYSLIKKLTGVEPLSSLATETLLLSPLALGYLAIRGLGGRTLFLSGDARLDLLLIGAGLMTALPLYCFGMASVRLDLAHVGFLQYIGPTIMLALGVFSFGEAFGAVHLLGFGLVWLALIIYSLSLLGRRSPARRR